MTGVINQQKLIIAEQKTIVHDTGQQSATIQAEISKRLYWNILTYVMIAVSSKQLIACLNFAPNL